MNSSRSSAIALSTFTPRSENDLVAAIREFSRRNSLLIPRGANSRAIKFPDSNREITIVDVSALSGVQRFEPADYYITCRAGFLLADLRRLLGEKDLHFPFLSSDSPGTVGGLVATAQLLDGANCHNISRWILALKVAVANGDIIKTGAVTYKSVAGYDLPKLFCGSFGTLGIIVEASLRLYPAGSAPYGKDLLPVARKSPILGEINGLKPANRAEEIALRIKKSFDPNNLFPAISCWNV